MPTAMRVASNTFPNSLVDQLAKLTERQNSLQSQVSTGQRIQLPEDDPTAMRHVMALQAEAKTQSQYGQNIQTLKDQTEAAYNALKPLKTVSDRAGEIAVLADGTKPPSELKLMASEVKQLIERSVQFANSQYRGAYLFAGTATGQPPFTVTTDANGWVTGVSYQGNDQVNQVEINQGGTMSAQIPGANTSGTGARGLLTDSRTGADLFQHLIDLQNHLRDGQIDQIASTDRGHLSKDEDNLISHLGSIGLNQSQLETAASLASDRGFSLEKSISKQADADLSQTIVRLNQTQTAYTAALQSGAKLLNLSLMDYLR